jgi:hypothetical protein
MRTIWGTIRFGTPAATTRMSAISVNIARSRVYLWQMHTVAAFCISIIATGLPTMLLAPPTTTLRPAISTFSCSSSFCTP